MKNTLMLSGIIAVLLLTVTDLPAQQPEVPAGQDPVTSASDDTMSDPVQVRHWVDRTALFAGDRVNYHLEIICAAGVDILPEDLDASQVELTGLELVSSDQSRTESGGRVTYLVRYSLTTYDLNTPSLQIGAQTIRYFAPRTAAINAESNTPAGEIVIPATALSLRSTLAADPMQSRLRDAVSAEIVPGGTTWFSTAGLVLILISGVPVGWWGLTLRRRRSSAVQHRQVVQASVKSDRSVLDSLLNISPASASERRQGYDQLDQILREMLTQSSGVQVNALSAAEMPARLSGHALGVPVDEVAIVVEDCEQARYGRPEQLPAVDRFQAGVELVRRLLIVH